MDWRILPQEKKRVTDEQCAILWSLYRTTTANKDVEESAAEPECPPRIPEFRVPGRLLFRSMLMKIITKNHPFLTAAC